MLPQVNIMDLLNQRMQKTVTRMTEMTAEIVSETVREAEIETEIESDETVAETDLAEKQMAIRT